MSEAIFWNIYQRGVWGVGSGEGSNPDNLKEYSKWFRKFLRDNDIVSIRDLGCGDCRSWRMLYEGTEYIGYDCCSELISEHQKTYFSSLSSFIHLDIIENTDDIEKGDLYILKDVLQHLNQSSIEKVLDTLLEREPKAKILIVNCQSSTPMSDIVLGGWRKFHKSYLDKYTIKEITTIQVGNDKKQILGINL
jgi:hypothetical protein